MDRYDPIEGESFYEVGNELRGWHSGKFATDAEAWAVLSERFNKSFPSRVGRAIVMRKIIGSGFTAGGNETETDKRIRLSMEEMLAADALEEATA